MDNDLKKLEEENKRLRQQVEFVKSQRDAYKEQLALMKKSFSWRVTSPLRFLLGYSSFIKNTVFFVKCVKKKGIGKTLQLEKERRQKNKCAFMLPLGKSEREKQKEYSLQNKYCFLVGVRKETTKENVQKTLETLQCQGCGGSEIVFLVKDDAEDCLEQWDETKAYFSVKKNQWKKLQKKIDRQTILICCEAGDCFYHGALYEIDHYLATCGTDVFYTDEVDADPVSQIYENFHYKPDFSPHYLTSDNYIGHVMGVRAGLFFDWLEQHLEILSVALADVYYFMLQQGISQDVGHIPQILYSRLPKQEIEIQREEAAFDLYLRQNPSEIVEEEGLYQGSRHLMIPIQGDPKISIIIPNCDHVSDLRKCIASILEKTDYSNYEIIIVENNSKKEETFDYYKTLKHQEKIKLITWEREFNYSAINNHAVRRAEGDYFLLLNNDIEVINPDWMTEMLMYAQQKEVGAVGAKLFFPDDTIQHAGVVLGVRGLAGHGHRNFPGDADGYMKRLKVVQDYSAVTAACLMISREKYEEIQGFDETLAVDYNDIDFCLRLRFLGYYNVYTPYARLYHYESKSRGKNITPEQKARVSQENEYFVTKWFHLLKNGDPFYNKNLSLLDDSFCITKNTNELS